MHLNLGRVPKVRRPYKILPETRRDVASLGVLDISLSLIQRETLICAGWLSLPLVWQGHVPSVVTRFRALLGHLT